MGALADSGLILQARPALVKFYHSSAIDGRSFRKVLKNVIDASGAPLVYDDVTAVCFASTKPFGTTVVQFDAAWSTVTVDAVDETWLTISADDEDMTGLAQGRRNRRCVWELTLDDGTDSLTVWSAATSTLMIDGRG